MENSSPRIKGAVVSLAVCVLCAGLMVLGAGCPGLPPTTTCEVDADCDDGLFCNGTETCVDTACTAGDNPCTEDQTCDEDADACVTEGCQSDDDCAEGQFCDTGTGECVDNVNLYEVTKVDADYEARVHFEPSGHTNCAACHHAADDVAGIPDASMQACVPCHSDDPDADNSYKAVAHDLNESGDGCRLCHDADWDNCAFCHPQLED